MLFFLFETEVVLQQVVYVEQDNETREADGEVTMAYIHKEIRLHE